MHLVNYKIYLIKFTAGPLPPADCNISDKELVTYNVKELNRFLKTKGTFLCIIKLLFRA